MSRIARIRRWPGDLAGPVGVVLTAGTASTAALAHREVEASGCPAMGRLSFRRIVDVPFGICMIALESWRRTRQDGELRIGQSLLRWPIEHDGDCGTGRIEVGLARGPLRPPLRMRLDVDRWYPSSSRTALELIPCQRVRPTAAYFRSGHLLLDSLTQSLRQHWPAQHTDRVPAVPPAE